MITVKQIEEHLTDTDWMRANVLPNLDTPPEQIILEVDHANDDTGSKWDDVRSRYQKSGVDVGKLVLTDEARAEYIRRGFLGIHDDAEFDNSAQVYLLETGEMVLILRGKWPYDTGKSISAYGEYGVTEERAVFPLSSDYAQNAVEMLIAKLGLHSFYEI